MPSLDRQFSILAIGYGLPSRGEHLLQGALDQIFVDGFHRNPVDAGTQRLVRHEAVGGMRRRGIYLDRLCRASDP